MITTRVGADTGMRGLHCLATREWQSLGGEKKLPLGNFHFALIYGGQSSWSAGGAEPLALVWFCSLVQGCFSRVDVN